MRTVALCLIAAVVLVVSGVQARRRWLRQASREAERAIARNRFRYLEGMEHVDYALRDKSARRREERQQAIENAIRNCDRPKRLQRVS